MGWLSKIFKGSNHKIKDGKYRRKSRNESSNSLPFSGNESEELDHAIAESLLEEELREANATETESNVDEDEQLAWALQESLYVASPSRQSTESPRRSTESPRRSTESSPRRSTESSPRRSIESSPRRSIESSLRRSSESSPRRSTESPPRRSTESTSRRSAESPPRQSTESPPQQNTKSLPWQTIESPPRQNDHIYEPTSFFLRKPRVCAGCNNEIGYGRFLSCLGGIWHPDCFRCYGCDQPITDNEFSMYGDYPYHKSCHRDLFHPKCDVCKHFIPPNMNGLIEYRSHPFWMQQYCPSHELDGTPRCCSCERMEHRDTKYVSLDDGRKLCLECLDSAVMDTYECQPLYLDIREFFEGLNMKVDQEIPLLLVERQALNEAMEGEKQGHHRLPETRGLCLSEEQVVSTISRRPRFGSKSEVTQMITEPYQLTRVCEVTAILILYGLPRLLIGSILAHEMMHAWLRLNGYQDLSPEVEEGICQVLAHMWIESEIMSGPDTNIASSSSSSSSAIPKKGTRSHSEKKLRDFFKRQIESDTSPVYGDGFRAGNEAVTKYGLRTTLDHIKLTTTFPY